jgi:SNF2 family DNA or RNA helicase
VKVIIRMGNSGNGVPVFIAAGHGQDLERPFGATWDADRHVWMYPAYYPAASKVIADLAVLAKRHQVEFSQTAQDYIASLDEIEQRYKNKTLPDAFTFVTDPYAHQVESLCHAFYFLRSALFLDPGLGKSKIAIDLIRLQHFLGERTPTIILGPLVTVKNWGKEIDKHSGKQLRWTALLGTKKEKTAAVDRAAAGEADILLLTYDTARNFVDAIVQNVPYRTVIADESHLIAKWEASRTKAAHELGQKASRKTIMTGTPTLGSPLDLYGQFRFLGDHFMPESMVAYKRKFVELAGPNSHVVLGYKNLDILNARTLFVSVRRKKSECLDLPAQTFVDVEYELSRHQAVISNQLVSEMALDIELLVAQLGGAAHDQLPPATELPHRAALLNKLLQICSGFLIKNNNIKTLCNDVEVGGCVHLLGCVAAGISPYTDRCQVAPEPLPDTITLFDENPKLDALVELLDRILIDPPNKVIVWCYYQWELNLVEAQLVSQGTVYVRVDGKTGARIQDQADRFNEDPAVRVYLAQVSTGVGITLNAAQYMIYFSLTYSLGAYLQSLDRNYRIGQTKNVTVYRLLGRNTIEPAIMRLLDNKVDVDRLLTQRLSCVVCLHSLKCIAAGVSLFDPDCVYPRSMSRPVAKAQLIQIRER